MEETDLLERSNKRDDSRMDMEHDGAGEKEDDGIKMSFRDKLLGVAYSPYGDSEDDFVSDDNEEIGGD
ncbi:conserved hypothetical protein [Ricinus communis]|uniref:Uncharacterized protein n=1 Tax=Ricinus communis TaxID=3988 RepID=B9RSV7_RICCO|nr:conserved hypothetical protein [Ricinus communis]